MPSLFVPSSFVLFIRKFKDQKLDTLSDYFDDTNSCYEYFFHVVLAYVKVLKKILLTHSCYTYLILNFFTS